VILYPNFPYIDVVYWTLGVEMSFYALVFALLVTGARRWISKSFFILGLVSAIFWALWYFEEWAGRGILHSIPQRVLQLSLLQHGCFFAIGGILWIMKERRMTIGEGALFALFLATAAAEIAFHAQTARTGGAVVPALVWLGFLLLMAWTVTHTMRVRDPRFAYAIRLAGLTTYPLYLLHQACGAAFLYWLSEAGLGPLPSLVIAFSAILAMATIVAGLIEPVVRRYTDRLIVMIGEMAQRRFARAN
jgi:peptidoglycan/LPS O-acetylase OafA/YrhL